MKNIFNKNKIGKNDNIDIGNYKNNKIKGPKNSVINDLSTGNDVSGLWDRKEKIHNDIWHLVQELKKCSECKYSYNPWDPEEIYENFEKVVICNNHMDTISEIGMKINRLKEINYLIDKLVDKK